MGTVSKAALAGLRNRAIACPAGLALAHRLVEK